ncbi:MAG: ATP-binding protein [Paracoccaceae bacterium]
MASAAQQVPGRKTTGLTRVERQDAASELDDFVYIVSHDLRASARALSEVPQWLRDDLREQNIDLSADLLENFELLERHAKRLDRMLQDLLVYSRTAKQQSVSTFSVYDLAKRVYLETPSAQHVRLDIEEDQPNMTMGYGDAFILFQTMLDNVGRHCNTDDPVLSIRAKRRRDTVTLTFTDNGPGVNRSDLARIFKPMITLKRKDDVVGSGMGLATVQRIVAHCGGDIWAGPGPDGTGLRVRLRLKDMLQ